MIIKSQIRTFHRSGSKNEDETILLRGAKKFVRGITVYLIVPKTL